MFETMLFRIRQGQIRALKETVERWQAEHKEAMAVRDVEDVIETCLELPESMRRLWNATFDRIAANEIVDLQDTGETLLAHFTGTLSFLEHVQGLARGFAGKGHRVEGADKLDRCLEQLRQLQHGIFEYWPWLPTPEQVAEAEAAIARGDSQTVEEILHELQNRNSPPGP
jgi:hypothetical protein